MRHKRWALLSLVGVIAVAVASTALFARGPRFPAGSTLSPEQVQGILEETWNGLGEQGQALACDGWTSDPDGFSASFSEGFSTSLPEQATPADVAALTAGMQEHLRGSC